MTAPCDEEREQAGIRRSWRVGASLLPQGAADAGQSEWRVRDRDDACVSKLPLKHGAMQKIQVLLPEPVLRDLREIAAVEDRPLSEVVRRAAEQMVRTYPAVRRKPSGVAVRTVDGGRMRAKAADLRALAYGEDSR